MVPAVIVDLSPAEIGSLQALLRENQLPDDDCANPALYFCAIFDGDQLIAAGGLEPAAPCALLRSVVVHPQYRGRGLAGRITAQLLLRSQQRGHSEVYLLTETAEDYFARHGFEPVQRSEVPPAIANTRQFSALCPQSACCMRLILSNDHNRPE